PNNPGGIPSVRFTVLPASVDTVAQISEWSGVLAAAPLERTGTLAVGAATNTVTISTSAATSLPNELVITNDGFKIAGGQTFTPGGGWGSLVNDAANGFGSEYRLDLPAAVASETLT